MQDLNYHRGREADLQAQIRSQQADLSALEKQLDFKEDILLRNDQKLGDV